MPAADAFSKAGVHVYCDSGDVVMAGGGYVALHAASAGEKMIRCPAPVQWREEKRGLLTGLSSEQRVVLHAGETKLFAVAR